MFSFKKIARDFFSVKGSFFNKYENVIMFINSPALGAPEVQNNCVEIQFIENVKGEALLTQASSFKIFISTKIRDLGFKDLDSFISKMGTLLTIKGNKSLGDKITIENVQAVCSKFLRDNVTKIELSKISSPEHLEKYGIKVINSKISGMELKRLKDKEDYEDDLGSKPVETDSFKYLAKKDEVSLYFSKEDKLFIIPFKNQKAKVEGFFYNPENFNRLKSGIDNGTFKSTNLLNLLKKDNMEYVYLNSPSAVAGASSQILEISLNEEDKKKFLTSIKADEVFEGGFSAIKVKSNGDDVYYTIRLKDQTDSAIEKIDEAFNGTSRSSKFEKISDDKPLFSWKGNEESLKKLLESFGVKYVSHKGKDPLYWKDEDVIEDLTKTASVLKDILKKRAFLLK